MTASLVFVDFRKAFDTQHRTWFKTTSGVLQGDTLSPYLFIVLLDYALKKTLQDDVGFVVRKRNGSWHPAIHIGVLACADDICL